MTNISLHSEKVTEASSVQVLNDVRQSANDDFVSKVFLLYQSTKFDTIEHTVLSR